LNFIETVSAPFSLPLHILFPWNAAEYAQPTITRFSRNRRERCGQCDDRPGVLDDQTLPPDPAEDSAIARRGEEPWSYTMENLRSVLHPSCPAKADALCKTRRRVEHGLTTVGLKIHCLGGNWELLNLIKALGGRSEVIGSRVYAHARASVTVILPPVGNARSAILLLECLERYFEHPIFHNPSYQIQVCSPCRLDGPRAAILAIAFYLGSDVLRRYSLGDLTTTFSEDQLGGHKHRGRRIVLYDGEGDLDRDLEWWDLEKDRLSTRPQPVRNRAHRRARARPTLRISI
jgi:hypothetical protein